MLISDHAEIDINTPTNAQIMRLLAFLVFSSSQLERRYITHPIITAITAITATYLISRVITFPIIP
jgi:hypothetical protein